MVAYVRVRRIRSSLAFAATTHDEEAGKRKLTMTTTSGDFPSCCPEIRRRRPRPGGLLLASMLFIIALSSLFLGRRAFSGRTSHSCVASSGRRSRQSNNIVLVALHLREGSDGALRLRVLGHNLRMLARSGGGNNDNGKKLPLRVRLIISASGDENAVRTAVELWRNNQLDPAAAAMVEDISFVPNDPVLVDAAKWIPSLKELMPQIEREKVRVMLANDSFLLTRDVPEMWEGSRCGDAPVCGLAWTGEKEDPTRHIQSYVRTLSACAAGRYVDFYDTMRNKVHSVKKMIGLFEMNLDWARDGGDDGAVEAMYDYAGAHPDADSAQRTLLRSGYPAIKLKKFYVTDDPWLSLPSSARPRISPNFSADVYRRANHDLNHLNDAQCKNHFAMYGKDEDRIYSDLPLVMKAWMKEEVQKMGEDGKETMEVLEEVLEARNRDLAVPKASST